MEDPWADVGYTHSESSRNNIHNEPIEYDTPLPSVSDIFGTSGTISMAESILEPSDPSLYGIQNNWGDYNSFGALSSDAPPTIHNAQTSSSRPASDIDKLKLEDQFSTLKINSGKILEEEDRFNDDKTKPDNRANLDATINENDEDNDIEEERLVLPPLWRVWDDDEINKFNPLSLKNARDGLFVKVREIPEKEGLVFKHINYLISHSIKFSEENTGTSKADDGSNETKVVRRYSDFSWLVEILWKKYPFRMIPELPPKKFALASSNDVLFLQKRRRGLQRFLYHLCKHPVLGKENLVIMFLTVPNDFSNWKRFANVEVTDEFEGVRINLPKRFKLDLADVMKGLREERRDLDELDREFDNNDSEGSLSEEIANVKSRNETAINNINQIWNESPVNHKDRDFVNNILATNEMLSKTAEIWSKLYLLVERIEKREIALAQDQHRFSLMLEHMVNVDTHVFSVDNVILNTSGRVSDDTENMNVINSILTQVGKYFNTSKKAKEDEMAVINNEILEKWKSFQDYLISMHFLMERFMTFKQESEKVIQDLLNKIIRSKDKIKQLKMKSDIRGSEVDKYINILVQAMNDLIMLISRVFLAKTIFVNEFRLFQKAKYLISEIFQDWFEERRLLTERQNDYIQRLMNDLRDMPLSA